MLQKNKPVLISTGIASQDDIQLALKTCYDAGNDKVILLNVLPVILHLLRKQIYV